MKRYPYSYRHTVYNETGFYEFKPLARKPVAPGERLTSLEIKAKFMSAVFDKSNITPMMAQIWSFYVPNRIVWDQWIDFIALDPAVPSVPTSPTVNGGFYEPVAGANVFPRRGVKLTYNSYFGDESQSANGAWYTNVLDDTDVTNRRLLAWDQYRASTRTQSGYTQQTFAASVSGAVATISLDDLQRALDAARGFRRQKVSGDKYVDTMRLFGVELDWRVQNAPEFLGAAQVILQPRERASSQAQDASGVNLLWKRASEYTGQVTMKLASPKAFAEHGYILSFCGFRPAFMAATAMPDSTADLPADFFRPETGNVMDLPAEGSRLRERFYTYLKGANVIGVNNNNNIFVNSAQWYPPSTDYVPIAGSGPNQMAIGAAVHYRGLSPVRPNVA